MTQNSIKQDFRNRLLIVDDEQTIRRLCVTVGESLGFSCLEAESGDAALALMEEQPVHMVLTDMVMPRMTGIEFLEQVKRVYSRVAEHAHQFLRARLSRRAEIDVRIVCVDNLLGVTNHDYGRDRTIESRKVSEHHHRAQHGKQHQKNQRGL